MAARVAEGLPRALDEMARQNVDVLLLGREGNARFVSGATRLWLAGTRPFAPGCVVVRETGEVHLMSVTDFGVPDGIPPSSLYPMSWNPVNIMGAVDAIPGVSDARRIGVDGLTPLFEQLFTATFPGAHLADGEAVMRAARRVKSAREIESIRAAVSVAEDALGAAIHALQPGVREVELKGAFEERMCVRGTTTPAYEGAFCVVDGETVVPLLAAQDFKRVGDGDTGPNTGGMGAYAPLPWLPADVYRSMVSKIVEPVAAELVRRDSRFSGLLYAGLAITANGPAVIEFNCRFGDPETQSVLALLESPLGQLLDAAATGKLASFGELRWRDGAALTVVLAAENYPGRPRVGDVVVGSEAAGVLHAGTARRDDGAIVSSGGRVLSAVGTGADLSEARAAAYDIIGSIRLPGSHFRSDIGLAAAKGKVRV